VNHSGYVPTSEASEAVSLDEAARPRLVFFYSPASGRCRRVEAFLAQALQRRHNHDTFNLVRVNVDRRQDLAERFRVTDLPTLIVVEGRKAVRRIVTPRGSRQLQRELSDWLH
jgi:thioredoxin 1